MEPFEAKPSWDFNVGDAVRKKLEDALKARGRVNVVIAGRSGVGKSTLINAVFQGRIAETGQGRPVTTNTREYRKEGIPLSVLDTRGLEMASYQETVKALEQVVRERTYSEDPMEHVHVAWLCISEDSRRVEEGETKVAEMLAPYMPVIVVVTKARSDQGFRQVVQSLVPRARNVMRVRALGEVADDGHETKPMGLVELVEATMEVVPEGQRNAFAAAQRVDIGVKKQRAHAVVAASALAAGGVGAAPIPWSDALAIVPIQVAMLAGITAVFGFPLTQAFLATLVASAAGAGGATYVGRTIVSGLLKLIPGVGSLVGGVIAATTAAALTTLVGEVYVTTLGSLYERNNGNPPTEAEIADAFGAALKAKRGLPG